tara:strand:- start:596 stop:1459 length:864 start_codon:yes stop_codon:yes gene_type:complete
MPEFAPTQKLDMAGVVVRKKMAKQRDIAMDDLMGMVDQTDEFGGPTELDEFAEGEFFSLRNELQPYTRIFSDKEIPEGIKNGINKRFRLINPPEWNSEHLFLNGVLQDGDGCDYVIHGNILTLKMAPSGSDKLLCTYYYTPFMESFDDVYDPLMFDEEGNYNQEDFFTEELHTLPDDFFQKFDSSGSFQMGDEYNPNDNFDFDDFWNGDDDEEYYDPLTDPDHPNYNPASDYTRPDYDPIYDPHTHYYRDPLTDPEHPDYNPLSDYTLPGYNPFTDPRNPDFESNFP